jgi:endoglucanase
MHTRQYQIMKDIHLSCIPATNKYRILLLCFILFFFLNCADRPELDRRYIISDQGAIVRMDTTRKDIFLVFTAHDFAEGFPVVFKVLLKHGIKASFFFTGDFYRNPEFLEVINTLRQDGHYLGAHSDKHLLYCTWEKRDSLLVTKEAFERDVMNNYAEMERFGIMKDEAHYFMPPYEWYNQRIADWTTGLGLKLINFTGGTSSNQDWTYPELGPTYISSDTIFQRITRYEARNGMKGFILLSHIGTDPRRKDKFYNRLDELVTYLLMKGYSFKRIE